jgi:FkbM family methyltransferase
MSVIGACRLLIRSAKYRFHKDRDEIKRLLADTPRGGVCVDVGAHKGAYTWLMAKRVGATGKVIAVEPQSGLCDRLRADLATLRCSTIQVVNCALSDRAGHADLLFPDTVSTQGATLEANVHGFKRDRVSVEVLPLDDLMRTQPRCDAIKIDAEGHEVQILQGALNTLRQRRPVVLVEAENHAGPESDHINQISALMTSVGYMGEFHDGHQWKPLAEFSAEIHQNKSAAHYCNNVYFRPLP